MVQLFYYENRGKQCETMLRHDGFPTIHVRLHAFEGWAQPALCSYWLIKFPWWSRRRCKIVQVSSGNRKESVWGRVNYNSDGCMFITGKFNSSKNPVKKIQFGDCRAKITATNSLESSARFQKQSTTKRRSKNKAIDDEAKHKLLLCDSDDEDENFCEEKCTVNFGDSLKCHFCLYLTTDVSEADFYMGYSLTGTLQRGNKGQDSWELTHYAMVRRKGY